METLIYNIFVVNSHREEKKVKKNVIIIEKGQLPAKVFYIKSGNVALAKNKKEKAFAETGENCFLGIKELVLAARYKFTARTTTPTTLMEIEGDVFLEKLNNDPELRLQIISGLSREIARYRNS